MLTGLLWSSAGPASLPGGEESTGPGDLPTHTPRPLFRLARVPRILESPSLTALSPLLRPAWTLAQHSPSKSESAGYPWA